MAMGGLVEGKVALVTGAGSGIGRASALAFAREGARLIVSDLDGAAAESTAEEVRRAGGAAHARRTDVTDDAQVRALVETALAAFGRLDCAHNNAGGPGRMAPMHQLELAEWDAVVAANLTSVFLCMRYQIPAMIERGGGAIVNTASGSGIVATPGLSSYCAAKHGVLGLTKTAAIENARTGVRINAVCPGSTDTPALRRVMATRPEVESAILASQPGGRLGRPEEIAEAVVWLCSDRASFVTGESLLVDGGAVAR
jgi:NAD(P)-dependent dehydrogenase (short-subunit alcohol dehydrogenase family)